MMQVHYHDLFVRGLFIFFSLKTNKKKLPSSTHKQAQKGLDPGDSITVQGDTLPVNGLASLALCTTQVNYMEDLRQAWHFKSFY